MNETLITVIMPAYNAQTTIELALTSIRNQTIPQESIEILVIDGGSTDDTVKLAEKYGAKVIANPDRLPEPAKKIGIANAHGKYVMWQDTDEVLIEKCQLEKRIAFLAKNHHVKCLVCDKQFPGESCGVAAGYLCVCGDPFTQFVYQRKNGVIDTFSKNITKKAREGYVFSFCQGDLTPIGDGGTTLFDFQWVKEKFPDTWCQQHFVCSIFEKICIANGFCGCIPEDNIIHFARATFSVYLSKLRFRIINNLFYQEESGYAARTLGENAKKLSQRKYWFMVYAVTLIGPVYDSIKLALKHRDATMLLHVFYVYYVCVTIVVLVLFSKNAKHQIKNYTYGEKR